jgi:hypothetical protein
VSKTVTLTTKGGMPVRPYVGMPKASDRQSISGTSCAFPLPSCPVTAPGRTPDGVCSLVPGDRLSAEAAVPDGALCLSPLPVEGPLAGPRTELPHVAALLGELAGAGQTPPLLSTLLLRQVACLCQVVSVAVLVREVREVLPCSLAPRARVVRVLVGGANGELADVLLRSVAREKVRLRWEEPAVVQGFSLAKPYQGRPQGPAPVGDTALGVGPMCADLSGTSRSVDPTLLQQVIERHHAAPLVGDDRSSLADLDLHVLIPGPVDPQGLLLR